MISEFTGEKKGLFHSEGNSTLFSRINIKLKGKHKEKPALWKRLLIGSIIGIANLFIKLFGRKDVTAAKISLDEMEDQLVRENEEIKRELIEAAKILKAQEDRKRRGGILRPSRKIIHRKTGLKDYGKFIDSDGNEITPIIRLPK